MPMCHFYVQPARGWVLVRHFVLGHPWLWLEYFLNTVRYGMQWCTGGRRRVVTTTVANDDQRKAISRAVSIT